jgi:hypothetical protein
VIRRWAPVAAAISVVAIVVAVSLVVGRGSSADPPQLRLAAGSGSDAASAADAPMAAGKQAASGSSFTLVGPLPSGPDDAKAQSLPRAAATVADVRRLAGALGVTDEPKRVEHAWQAGVLRVEDAAGNPWSMYAGCGPDVAVSSDGGSVAGCSTGTLAVDPSTVSSGTSSGSGYAPAPGAGSVSSSDAGSGSSTPGSSGSGGSSTVGPPPAPEPAPALSPCPDNARCAKPGWVAPPPPSPGPTADVNAARRAAKLVLDDLGLSAADVTVEGAGEHAFVQASPRVAGLPTWGYSTQLEVDAEGHIASGSGYLGQPTSGPSYPLVSARAAFDALPEQPRTMMLCPAGADCPQPVPAEVTGAELGLQLTALADEEAALLPAWLFTVKGWPMPLAQAAIEPRFLSLPKDEPVQVDPGLVDPVPPAVPPSHGDPTAPRSSFSFDAAFPADEPNVLIVQYGDSGSCPHTNVQPLVKESADSVVVTLEGDTQPGKQICTDDYRQQLVTLKLASPLADRKVIDGSRGEPVAVDRTCGRPMRKPPAPKSCQG